MYNVMTRNGSTVTIETQHRLLADAVLSAQTEKPRNLRTWIESLQPDLSIRRYYPDGSYHYTKLARTG